jgi:hypothetical protein
MVPQPTITAPFNAFLQPLVRICRWATGCVSAPIDFTRTTGPGSEVIRVSPTDKQYHVNWHTDQFDVQPGEEYRIQVFADRDGQFLLGFADVEIAATGKEAKKLTTEETIGLVDGRTLPIKFFAGIGALGECEPDGPTCAEAIVSPDEGGLVVAVNADGEAEAFADFPSDWTDEPTTVKLDRLPNTPQLGAPEGLHQWPLFYEFTASVVREGEEGPERFPAGQFARRVRIGVCNIDNPLGDPDHPEDRGTISLGIGRGDRFRTLPAADAADILGLCEGVTLAVRSGADANGWRALLAGVAAVATDVLLPRPLHASAAAVVDGGAGGSTDSFESPVGTVEGRPDLAIVDVSNDDVGVAGFRMSPANPVVGQPVTFTAVVTNIGRVHAGRTFAVIEVGRQAPGEQVECPATGESENPLTASLAPGEECTVIRSVTFETAGDYTATAMADAVGDLATESNELNNTASLQFTVVPAAADLIIESLTHLPANPTDVDLIEYTAVVKNVGTAPAGRFQVLVNVNEDADGTPGRLIEATTLSSGPEGSSLDPGESVSLRRQRTLQLSAGSYINTATADIDEQVAEANESNNTMTERYTVTAAPTIFDATFTSDALDAAPGTPEIGTWTSTGTAAGTVLVRAAVGDLTQKPVELDQIGGLTGGVHLFGSVAGRARASGVYAARFRMLWHTEAAGGVFVLRDTGGLVLCSLGVGPLPVLRLNNAILDGVSWTPDVAQSYEITVDLNANVCSLKVNDVAAAGAQGVPFFQSAAANLQSVELSHGGTFAQTSAWDDIRVVRVP